MVRRASTESYERIEHIRERLSFFQADLLEYTGGTVIGGQYRPAVLSGNAGTISLTFTSSSTGTVQLPGEPVQDVSLFVFDQ